MLIANTVYGRRLKCKCVCFAGCYYIDKKSEKEYQYNITSGELLSVSSDRDDSYVRFTYDDKHRIERIAHSSGAYIDVSCDDTDRIVSATIRNSTNNVDQTV